MHRGHSQFSGRKVQLCNSLATHALCYLNATHSLTARISGGGKHTTASTRPRVSLTHSQHPGKAHRLPIAAFDAVRASIAFHPTICLLQRSSLPVLVPASVH